MNQHNQKRAWSMAGLFMVMLVLTMPIYSANALAAVSLSITKNYGEEQIEQFLDGQGDVWTVEATISGVPDGVTVDPAEVKIKVGNAETPFNSCGSSALGTSCEYISPMTDGIIEGEYNFQVVYEYLDEVGNPAPASDSDVIKSDTRGPVIEIIHLEQGTEPGQIEIDFTVNDKFANAPSVGIKNIEVVDADSGAVLQAISIPEPGMENYQYTRNSGFGNVLQSSFDGEGRRRVRVRGEDWLGHPSQVSPVAAFKSDFVVPIIQGKLEFPDLGEFIGPVRVTSDMTVDVLEADLDKVTATAEGTSLRNSRGLCTLDDEEDNLWHCQWDDVELDPAGTISVTFSAEDDMGNIAERTLTKTFTVDDVPPVVEFFGTLQTYQGQSYVHSGKQEIILITTDAGVGIDESGIVPNLDPLGIIRHSECNETAGQFVCIWETSRTFNSDGVVRIGLTVFQDKVGNRGDAPLIELQVDTFGPKVEDIEVYGVSEAGEKDYFQSEDVIRIKLEAIESSGLVVLVNLNDLVPDAKTIFPETDGWMVVEEGCQREEGKWVCLIDTPAIMSGPDSYVELEMKVQDTAGNDAQLGWASASNVDGQDGDFSFSLLGRLDEESPDNWETGSVSRLLPFVNLDTTELTHARIPFTVTLNPLTSNVEAIDIELLGCVEGEGVSLGAPTSGTTDDGVVPAVVGYAAAEEETEEEEEATPASSAPTITRNLLYRGVGPDGSPVPQPRIILEFEPFDGRELFNLEEDDDDQFVPREVKYTCQLKIFSKVFEGGEHKAMRFPELQEVELTARFAFTKLGSLDENLDSKVQDIKDEVWFTIADKISWLSKGIEYVRFGLGLLQVLYNGNLLLNIFRSGGDALRAVPIVGEAASKANCIGVTAAQEKLNYIVKGIQIPLQVLSCNPTAWESYASTWYGKYQLGVLRTYNLISGLGPIGAGATSLYDNLYVSMIGLCLPGMIYNLEKYRQIRCREIICLEREVPAGIATVGSCAALGDQLYCEYFIGPLLQLSPLNAVQFVVEWVKSFFTSVAGLVQVGLTIACAISCSYSGSVTTLCVITKVVTSLGDIVEIIVGAFNSHPGVTVDPYCSQIE